jgi:hypothetical protein
MAQAISEEMGAPIDLARNRHPSTNISLNSEP